MTKYIKCKRCNMPVKIRIFQIFQEAGGVKIEAEYLDDDDRDTPHYCGEGQQIE